MATVHPVSSNKWRGLGGNGEELPMSKGRKVKTKEQMIRTEVNLKEELRKHS